MGNSLYPEKDYIGLGDGPLDPGDLDQGYGAAYGAAIGTGITTSPVIGTVMSERELSPLAKQPWVPFIGSRPLDANAPSYTQDDPEILYTTDNPKDVEARGDKLFQTEDELKLYPGYNSKIPFEPGMTKSRYDGLVEMRTEQLRREAALAGHPFINIFGQIIGGAPDPSSYVPVFGQLGNAWKLGKGARLGWNIVKSGGEGAIGSTLATAAISDREKALGNDMSLKAYVETAALGFFIGGTFGTLGHAISRALGGKTPQQQAASQTIVSSPITPQSAPDAVAVLADAYDSFMVNNGLATPYYAGGKGGPIQFGSHSQEAFTNGMKAAQRSVDLNWQNVAYERNSRGDVTVSIETQNFVSQIPEVKEKAKDSVVRDPGGGLSPAYIGSPVSSNTQLVVDELVPAGSGSNYGVYWASNSSKYADLYSTMDYEDFADEIVETFPDFNTSPNVRPIFLNMVNPYIMDLKGKELFNNQKAEAIKLAKEKGYDGVIFNNAIDTVPSDVVRKAYNKKFKDDGKTYIESLEKPATIYAIFDPEKQIIDMQSVANSQVTKAINAQQAYLDARAAKAASTVETSNMKSPAITGYDFGIKKGYDYDSQAVSNTNLSDIASNKFIDVLPLIRAAEKNDEVKYKELSNEAAGLDLEAKTTGFEDEMELALAKTPITPAEEAFALKVDQDIAAADKLEDFINAAIKCMGVA